MKGGSGGAPARGALQRQTGGHGVRARTGVVAFADRARFTYAHIRPLDAAAVSSRSRDHLSQSRHRRRAATARAPGAAGAARGDGAPAVAVRAARAARSSADAVAARVSAP